jgi:hypothetical protein
MRTLRNTVAAAGASSGVDNRPLLAEAIGLFSFQAQGGQRAEMNTGAAARATIRYIDRHAVFFLLKAGPHPHKQMNRAAAMHLLPSPKA